MEQRQFNPETFGEFDLTTVDGRAVTYIQEIDGAHQFRIGDDTVSTDDTGHVAGDDYGQDVFMIDKPAPVAETATPAAS